MFLYCVIVGSVLISVCMFVKQFVIDLKASTCAVSSVARWENVKVSYQRFKSIAVCGK